jgi:hypothetical protein
VKERHVRADPILRAVLIAMGVFTAVPALVLVDPGQLASYGLSDPEPMVLTLLQHRGVYQLLAGAALIWAALRPEVRLPVAIGVIVSKSSALLLTVTRPEAQAMANPGIQLFDTACVIVLAGIVVGEVLRRTRRDTTQVPA